MPSKMNQPHRFNPAIHSHVKTGKAFFRALLLGAAMIGCTGARSGVPPPAAPAEEFGSDSVSWLAETERFVLARGYRGPLVVLYNDSTGISGDPYRASRTYRVPATGVVRIRDGNPSPSAEVDVLMSEGSGLVRIRMYGDCFLPIPATARYGCWLPHLATSRMRAPFPFYVSGMIGPFRDVYAECARAMVVVDSVVFAGKLQELRKCPP